MQYENKILISAILIIGLALVSFNVVKTDISGWQVRQCDSISVSAQRNGVYVDVTILNPPDSPPGTNYNGPGESWIYYYDSEQDRKGRQQIPGDLYDGDAPTMLVSIKDLYSQYGYVSVEDKCIGEKIWAQVQG